jgi:2-methylisocitrate lyase-like PEP mutase family enzyme
MTDASSKRRALAARVRERRFFAAPGVFDLISARLADTMGFECLYMTGYGATASYLGLPDAGIATYTQMADRARTIAEACATPLIADADTGYGGLLNVHHTVRGYEAGGVAGIQIEDQEFPKKCGHTPGRRVIPLHDMLNKIKVAVDARRDPDFLIVARTDARTGLGLDEAIRRGQAFAAAGADVVFVESPESAQEFARVGREIDVPLLANMVEQGRSPLLDRDTLSGYGFALAIHPGAGFMAAAKALEQVYGYLRANGSTSGMAQPLYSFEQMNKLMGFEEVWAFDRKWADTQR